MTFLQNISRLLGLRVVYHYKIEKLSLERPPAGSMVIFKLPSNTPQSVVNEVQARLVEFQNQDMEFMVTTIDIEYIETEIGMVRVEKKKKKAIKKGE